MGPGRGGATTGCRATPCVVGSILFCRVNRSKDTRWIFPIWTIEGTCSKESCSKATHTCGVEPQPAPKKQTRAWLACLSKVGPGPGAASRAVEWAMTPSVAGPSHRLQAGWADTLARAVVALPHLAVPGGPVPLTGPGMLAQPEQPSTGPSWPGLQGSVLLPPGVSSVSRSGPMTHRPLVSVAEAGSQVVAL